jgi:hypothetical protein
MSAYDLQPKQTPKSKNRIRMDSLEQKLCTKTIGPNTIGSGQPIMHMVQ